MDRTSQHPANHQPQAASIASEWGKTFLTQTAIGILLAVLWATLGLQ
ncbi:MAG: hypothetical protein HYY64_15380 [Candidatus Rokubacteria bacterium]|nr:hypothetical protein [Candidatus Rokubacteria bacterium]